MSKSSSKVHCSGASVTRLRVRQGMTQEKLAAMSNVNIRTVQRAEKSDFLQLETVASLAAALKATVPELTVSDSTDDRRRIDEDDAADGEPNAVVLRRITSGKALLDILWNSFSGKLYCEVEPTTANVDALTTMVEEIERLIPEPWATPQESVSMSLAERLRTALAWTTKLSSLETFDVAIFAGTYTARAQVPRYDLDEGHMYTLDRFPFESVTICRVMLAKKSEDRVVLKVTDKWTEPAPTKPESNDDIPF
jgi:transcriptional regulator with XRE-family HTH domain